MSIGTQRIDQYWAEFFGMQHEDFLQPGIAVIPHAKLNGYQGVWSLRHGASLTTKNDIANAYSRGYTSAKEFGYELTEMDAVEGVS